ncbi:Trehalase [Thalictrum thalictroides]|uniref:Trehalase n=1 Tax=Thalictrum thalictroides TaxID=46969 RepID=A0A7J6V6L0_THATH|nr:Trehalase [Thalictrum thalictroides]
MSYFQASPKYPKFVVILLLSFTMDFGFTEASTICNTNKQPTPLISFLEKLQQTGHTTYGDSKAFDPKYFMDVSLKFNLVKTIEAFDKLPKLNNGSVSVHDFERFSNNFLNKPGSDLVYHEPEDFVPEPVGFLPNVENAEVRAWALEVHSLWKNLSRRVADGVVENPELHTLLPLPKPVIIPGSRFLEIYYWDSYWVIRGLLVSKMYKTAKSIVHNLISLIDEYGYVLNGARAYYSNRSQPPLLSSMVLEIYKKTHDLALVKQSLPALLKEHQFWNSGIHKVIIQDGDKGSNYTLSRYFAMWNKPRPESSTIDKETASKLLNVSEKQHLYRELASTAESGWDFSTRWMRNHTDLTTLSTTSIVPVDLNAYILKMELDIVFLAKTVGDKCIAEQFLKASEARGDAMNSVFWNDKKGQWLDYWLTHSNKCEEVHRWDARKQNQNTYASNFIPVWIELFNSDKVIVKKLKRSLQESGLLCDAGIATSLINSGQQWDFPNGWAPVQHMIVEGFARSGLKDARSMAEDIAVKWLKTNYAAYKKTGTMHEKYDVESCGAVGGGGEYIPQTGFGWTNGVALAFLEEFGWPQNRSIDC